MKSKNVNKIILIITVLIFISALIVTKLLPWFEFRKYKPQNGDLLFQSLPVNDLVLAIEGISESLYSHCGIVVDRGGDWFVLEAIGPVKYTPIYEWVKRGRNQNFAVCRLKNKQGIDSFIAEAEIFLGRPYDVRYRFDDENIYCSELIYKAYEKSAGIKLGLLKKLGAMPWEKYKQTVEKYEKGPVPLEREMITPANLSRAKELRKVFISGDEDF